MAELAKPIFNERTLTAVMYQLCTPLERQLPDTYALSKILYHSKPERENYDRDRISPESPLLRLRLRLPCVFPCSTQLEGPVVSLRNRVPSSRRR